MAEVDRLIAESEAYLESSQRDSMDVSDVMETTSRVLASARGPCTLDVTTDDEDDESASSSATPTSESPASEAIVAAACAVANTASNLLNDSEIEILDCTTFPLPLPADDDDEVYFVSETLRNRNVMNVVDLMSPSPQININANFGSNPTNISVNIDLGPGRSTVRPAPPVHVSTPLLSRATTSQASSSDFINQMLNFARGRPHHLPTPRQIHLPTPTARPHNLPTSTARQQRLPTTIGKKRKPAGTVEPAKKPSPEPTEPETSGNGFACAVCLEDLKGHLKPVSTNCGHLFCLNCLQQAIRVSGKCPLCNKKQGKNTFHRIYI